jgi:hypothetical protein
LPFPNLATDKSAKTLTEIGNAAARLSNEFVALCSLLAKYEKLSRKNPPPFEVKKNRRHYYVENTFTLQSSLGWGLHYQLRDLQNELTLANARVFILTGRAGQGKTN